MSRFLTWLLVLLLFSVFGAAAILVLLVRVGAGKGFPPFSVYSSERDGLIESARLLRKLGWEPVALTRPVQQDRQRGLLVLVEPSNPKRVPGEAADLSDNEVRTLLRWVEQGNTLLLCGRQMNGLHRALNVTLTGHASGPRDIPRAVEIGEAGGYTEGIDLIVVEGRDSIRAPGGLPLWWTAGQEPGAILLRRGEGRVLVVADSSTLTLRGLLRADNAIFLYNVAALDAREDKVYFDEYHHGLRSAGGFWGYLRHHDQQWALLPVLLVVLAALWAVAVRLGPATPTPPESRADAVDYASAVARIYQCSGARRLLARTVARGFLEPLTRRLGLRPAALTEEVLAAWQRQDAEKSTKRLEGLLRGAAEIQVGDVSERRLLSWTQAFDQFEAEVMSAR